MKGSLATSAVIHAAVLTLALVSLGSPESFDVANVEALPVDPDVVSYCVDLAAATRRHPALEVGASPRGRTSGVPAAFSRAASLAGVTRSSSATAGTLSDMISAWRTEIVP